MEPARDITSYRKYWAARFGTAPFLPMTRAEMDALGWDSCDIIIVTGDAYVDHPSFGMAIIGRAAGGAGLSRRHHRAARLAQRRAVQGAGQAATCSSASPPATWIRWSTATPADRRIRSDDAYTPGGEGGKRPDRSVIVYAQRCARRIKDVPIVLGGIEASLRRIAHYDYWSDKVRRSILVDAKADLLLYGNAERAIVEIAHRLAAGEPIDEITDVRGTAFVRGNACRRAGSRSTRRISMRPGR